MGLFFPIKKSIFSISGCKTIDVQCKSLICLKSIIFIIKNLDFKCCHLYRLSVNTFPFVHFKLVITSNLNKVTDPYERALQPGQQRFH